LSSGGIRRSFIGEIYMRRGLLARAALVAVACGTISHAALLPLGAITFNQIGDSGEFAEFRVYNRTATAGYPVLTPVTFSDVVLRIDILDGETGHLLQISNSMAPQGAAYDSEDIYKTVKITRAVLNASFSPGTSWQISGVGAFSPQNPELTMILLPGAGSSLDRGTTWDILLDTATNVSNIPEPATYLLSGAALGLGLLRRRRSQNN
jgi:hypothetical protein